jgi:hypothetical protein
MFVCNVQASEVFQLVRFPTMDQQELCEAAKHPVVVGDPKVQVRMPNPHAAIPHTMYGLATETCCIV